jgi:hypothetical protein
MLLGGVCIRQHTSAYVNIRQHTSTYGGVGGDQVSMLLELRQADFFGLIETHPSVASVLYENMSDVVSTMRRGMRRRVVIQYRTVSCAV